MSVQTFNVVGGMWLLGIFLSILGFTYAYTFKPSVTLKIVREVLGAILCVIHMVLILYTGSLLHMNEILTWVIVGGIFVGDRIAINMLMLAQCRCYFL